VQKIQYPRVGRTDIQYNRTGPVIQAIPNDGQHAGARGQRTGRAYRRGKRRRAGAS